MRYAIAVRRTDLAVRDHGAPLLAMLLLAAVTCGCGGGSSDGRTGAGSGSDVETLVDGGLGDGGRAIDAPIRAWQLAIDAGGDVFLADGRRVRKIDAGTRTISTLVETDAGPSDTDPRSPRLRAPEVRAVAVDGRGTVYFATDDGRVSGLDVGSRDVTHVAGRRASECPELAVVPAGRATEICIGSVADMVVDANGDVLLAAPRGVLRLVVATGELRVVAAQSRCSSFDPAAPCLDDIQGLALDDAGDLLVAAFSGIHHVDLATGAVTTIVPVRACRGEYGDGGPAADACVERPFDVTVAGGDLVIDDGTIRRVDGRTGVISTFAVGNDEDRSGLGFVALATDPHQRVVAIGLGGASRVFRFDSGGGARTVIGGNGTYGHCGDGGHVRDACLGRPADLALASDGTIYVFDQENNRLRRFDMSADRATTIAGTGLDDEVHAPGECPTREGPATETCVSDIDRIVPRADGTMYVLDFGSGFPFLRRIDAAGTISTVIRDCDSFEEPPGNAPIAVEHACMEITDIAVAPDAIYLAEPDRVWRLVGGTLFPVFATSCPQGGVGRDDPSCYRIWRVAVSPGGTLALADESRVRVVDPATGEVTVLAGRSRRSRDPCPENIDGGPAIGACLTVKRLLYDRDGNLLIGGDGSVRRVDAATGSMATIAGRAEQRCIDDGRAAWVPAGLGCATVGAIDSEGRILFVEVADDSTARVIRLTVSGS